MGNLEGMRPATKRRQEVVKRRTSTHPRCAKSVVTSFAVVSACTLDGDDVTEHRHRSGQNERKRKPDRIFIVGPKRTNATLPGLCFVPIYSNAEFRLKLPHAAELHPTFADRSEGRSTTPWPGWPSKSQVAAIEGGDDTQFADTTLASVLRDMRKLNPAALS